MLNWLNTAPGRDLFTQEVRLSSVALERVFGDQLVQIGSWGQPGALLKAARTQFTVVLGARNDEGVGAESGAPAVSNQD